MSEVPLVIELSVRLDAPPHEVFAFLTDAERYVKWQGVKAELDPRPGGVYRVWMDAGTVARGEYMEVDPPRRIVFTWGWEGNVRVPPRLDHGRAHLERGWRRHGPLAPPHGSSRWRGRIDARGRLALLHRSTHDRGRWGRSRADARGAIRL
jgi:uncharacterized protein YndB with AHSA1/START domain